MRVINEIDEMFYGKFMINDLGLTQVKQAAEDINILHWKS